MGLLPDTQNCEFPMRRECRERFPRHRLPRKQLVSDPGMHHGTCVTHVPWCMSGSLTRGGEEHVPGIPGACATRNFAHLTRGPYSRKTRYITLLLIHWLIASGGHQQQYHSHCEMRMASSSLWLKLKKDWYVSNQCQAKVEDTNIILQVLYFLKVNDKYF